MALSGDHIWNPDNWEQYAILLLRQRYGSDLTPVPDQSGGDGGLEAFTSDGVAWQAYAPENEPLQPKARYVLQRGKITTDLGKLAKDPERVKKLLGPVVLKHWILLTPKNESSDLVAHCSTKTDEVRNWGLDFIAPDFRVSVQTRSDFAHESALIQAAGLIPGDVFSGIELPEETPEGLPFSSATGPLIEIMDQKLAKVMRSEIKRAAFRSEYLKAQIAGEDLLGRLDDQVPDVSASIRGRLESAKSTMLLRQALDVEDHGDRLVSVEADIIGRVNEATAKSMPMDATEVIARATIARWLQECTMSFDEPDGGDA